MTSTIQLTINGEGRTLSAVESLGALIEQLGMKSDRVAIELNREIVPREQWAQTQLKNGDRLEIVHFVGGGLGSAGFSQILTSPPIRDSKTANEWARHNYS